MPRPKGAENRDKIWKAALQKAVRRVDTFVDEKGKVQAIRRLDRMADAAVARGMEGDVAALKEIGDRLDGKATQAIDVSGHVQIERIERISNTVTPAPTLLM